MIEKNPKAHGYLIYILNHLDNVYADKMLTLHTKYADRLLTCQGSQHNHQAWAGGYIDHVLETIRIAITIYWPLRSRTFDFSLSSVLTVLLVHDIEKLFPERIDAEIALGMPRPKAKDRVRYNVLHEEGIWDILTNEEKDALDHIEGEKGYDGLTRKMSPLAAFCHSCDILSARMWYDRPLIEGDIWGQRYATETDKA